MPLKEVPLIRSSQASLLPKQMDKLKSLHPFTIYYREKRGKDGFPADIGDSGTI